MALRICSLKPKINDSDSFQLGQLTVLVGPNNCGKSQTLRDIRDYLQTGNVDRLLTIGGMDIQLPGEADAFRNVTRGPHSNPGHTQISGVGSDLQKQHQVNPNNEWLKDIFSSAKDTPSQLKQLLERFGTYWIAYLDAERRFQLAAPSPSYNDRNESPTNALQAFFKHRQIASPKLREAFRNAFGVDIALDWAGMTHLALVIGDDFGDNIPEELDKLKALLENAQQLALQGDGYRSFAGVVLSTLTFSDRVLLLDEPEAFLHPAQARSLGRWIASAAKKRSGQVIVASHSADFLLGVVSTNQDATVVRLNRSSKGTTYHSVPSTTTAGLINSPLLSSQPVMDALFHRGVVVCEGDADRAVYQTIAHSRKLLGQDGGEDILFIHSNGKDAAWAPIKLLREAGTPVCAVLDLDVLNTLTVFTKVYQALTGKEPFPELLQLRENVANSIEPLEENNRLSWIRESVERWLKENPTDLRRARKSLKDIADEGADWEQVKKKGVAFFKNGARRDVKKLIKKLREDGLLLVPCGQLESWMPFPEISKKGSQWNRAALEQLGKETCPRILQAYVRCMTGYLGSAFSEVA